MEFSLAILLIIYLIYVVIFIVLSLVNLYHVLHFGFTSFTAYVATFVYVIMGVSILLVTYYGIIQIDWTRSVEVFSSGSSGIEIGF